MQHAKEREVSHWFVVVEKPLLAIRVGPILVSVYLADNQDEAGSASYRLLINEYVPDGNGNHLPQTTINAGQIDGLLHALSMAKDWLSKDASNPQSSKRRLEEFLTAQAPDEQDATDFTQHN